MPQVVALAVVGAGLYAGYRWVSRQVGRMQAEARRAEDEIKRRAAAAAEPKDLGSLVYDDAKGVYRPQA
jgi:hypothetical protein